MAEPCAGGTKPDKFHLCASLAPARARIVPSLAVECGSDLPSGRPEPPFVFRTGKRITAREAEGEGFEPSRDLAAPNGFRDRPVQPLRHPSGRKG